MTRAGQILVFVNLAFCALLAAWAVVNYVVRPQWGQANDAGKMVGGELKTISDELDTEIKGYAPAAAAWAQARDDVMAREAGLSAVQAKREQFAGRWADRLWYENELRLLRSTATDASPAHVVDRDPTGQLKLDPANYNRPKVSPATERDQKKPLRSLAYYDKQDGDVLAKTYDELLKLIGNPDSKNPDLKEGLIQKDTKLTDRMNGPKGLKQRLEDERAKGKALDLELSLMEPVLVNAALGSQTIVDRDDELLRRIEQLNKSRGGD
jgi:hypothetical protein